jgi:hypothetical protein
MLVPADTPVTRPVLLTVATRGDADTHGLIAAGVPEPVSCVVDPAQTLRVPVMVGAPGTVLTVKAVAEEIHPRLVTVTS